MRRAAQRAEPGALQGHKGRTVGSGLGDSTDLASSTYLLRAARPEGKARRFILPADLFTLSRFEPSCQILPLPCLGSIAEYPLNDFPFLI